MQALIKTIVAFFLAFVLVWIYFLLGIHKAWVVDNVFEYLLMVIPLTFGFLWFFEYKKEARKCIKQGLKKYVFKVRRK